MTPGHVIFKCLQLLLVPYRPRSSQRLPSSLPNFDTVILYLTIVTVMFTAAYVILRTSCLKDIGLRQGGFFVVHKKEDKMIDT